jgi:hypothetical protein
MERLEENGRESEAGRLYTVMSWTGRVPMGIGQRLGKGDE